MTQLIKQSWTSYPNIFFLFVCFVCTKLIVCFVDLQKAFDSVWRNGLLFKLVKIRPSLLSDITRRSSANNNDPMLELTSLGGSDSTELKLNLE
jgi:hypothetical protein